MMWFKVCNSLSQHRKALEAGPEALGLWTLAGAWSCGQLTNGFVPDYALIRLVPNAEALASRLVQAGLWSRTDGGYHFHEWSEYQPDAETERQKQEQRREAGRKGGVSSGKSRRERRNTKTSEATAKASASASARANAQAKPEAKTNPDTDTEGTSKEVPPCSPRDRFDEFWSAYPCKKAKKAARKSWEAALKDADAETIIGAARRYADARSGQDPQYTAMPTTWLNQGRWDDEPTPAHRPQPQMSTADRNIAELQARKRHAPEPETNGRPVRALSGGRSA